MFNKAKIALKEQYKNNFNQLVSLCGMLIFITVISNKSLISATGQEVEAMD